MRIGISDFFLSTTVVVLVCTFVREAPLVVFLPPHHFQRNLFGECCSTRKFSLRSLDCRRFSEWWHSDNSSIATDCCGFTGRDLDRKADKSVMRALCDSSHWRGHRQFNWIWM
jgi:hypothetical protein